MKNLFLQPKLITKLMFLQSYNLQCIVILCCATLAHYAVPHRHIMLCYTSTLCCATPLHYNVPFHVFNFLIFYSRKHPVIRTSLECFPRVFIACNFRSHLKRKVAGWNFWGEQHHKPCRFVLDYGGTAELA